MNPQQPQGGASSDSPAVSKRRARPWMIAGVVGLVVLVSVVGVLVVRGHLFGGIESQVASILKQVRKEEQSYNSTTINRLRYSLPGPLSSLVDWMFPRDWKGDYYYRVKLVELGTNCVPILNRIVETDGSISARRICAGALAALQAREATPVLTKVLRSASESETRSAMAEALGDMGDTNAVPSLVQAMQLDSSPQVRGAGAKALGDLKVVWVVPDVIASLANETNRTAKVEMVQALGTLRDARALPVVIKVLNDLDDKKGDADERSPGGYSYETYDSYEVRARAAEALGRIGGETAVNALIARLEAEEETSVAEAICRALGALRDVRAVPALLARLEEDARTKPAAVEALGDMGDVKVVPRILLLLEERDKDLRAKAAVALGKLGSTDAVAELKRLIEDDPAEEVRSAACGALALIGDVSAQDAIASALPRLKDHRAEAIWALGHLGDTNSVSAIAEYLDDSSGREDSFAAAYALAEIGGPEAVAALKGKLDDKDEYARHGKACAFAMLGQTGSLSAVRKGLRSENDWQRFGAAIALVRLGGAVGTNEFNPLLNDRVPALRRFGVEARAGRALPALVVVLQGEDESFRHYAARALAFFKDASAIPALREACQDRDPEVREAARLTLQRIERELGK